MLEQKNMIIKNPRLLPLLILAAAAVVYFGSLWQRPLFVPDEIRYAEIPREMLASGNWAVPHLAGLPYFEKPAGGYWLSALALRVFGENPFAVRFFSALCTLLTSGVIYLLVRRGNDKPAALTAMMLYLSTGLVAAVGTYAVLDAQFVFFVVLAVCMGYFYSTASRLSERLACLALSGIALGCGIMIKGLLAPFLAGLAMTGFFIWQKEYKKLFFAIVPVMIFMLFSALPGAWYMHLAAPGFWKEFIVVEHLSRAVSGAGAADDRSQPFWYYIPVLTIGLLPTLLFVPSAAAAVGKQWKAFFKDPLMRLCASTVVLWVLFFSCASGKLATYVLPCFPFMVIMIAKGLCLAADTDKLWISNRIFKVFAAVLGVAALLFVCWHFMKFIPGKYKLCSPRESAALFMTVLVVVLWFNMAARTEDTFARRKLRYYITGMAILLFSVPILMPQKVVRFHAPERFILRTVAQHFSDGTKIYADGSMAAAVVWSCKLNSVDVMFKPGELLPGLKKVGRTAFSIQSLKEQALDPARSHSIIIFTRSRRRVREFPAPKTVLSSGRNYAVIYKGKEK